MTTFSFLQNDDYAIKEIRKYKFDLDDVTKDVDNNPGHEQIEVKGARN